MNMTMTRRTDVPASAVESSGLASIVTEWLGVLAAVIAIVLFVLVGMAIHKGLLVQGSARQIVANFRTTNGYFASRADFNAPTKAKQELQQLRGVLAQLNTATATDVTNLAATMPDVTRLLAAGKGDVSIAGQLLTIGNTLQGSAGSLQQIAVGAYTSVSSVDSLLTSAGSLVNELNAQLAITEQKLALLPATGSK
jgi:hypothetical protein